MRKTKCHPSTKRSVAERKQERAARRARLKELFLGISAKPGDGEANSMPLDKSSDNDIRRVRPDRPTDEEDHNQNDWAEFAKIGGTWLLAISERRKYKTSQIKYSLTYCSGSGLLLLLTFTLETK
jgi:hypothetical protein